MLRGKLPDADPRVVERLPTRGGYFIIRGYWGEFDLMLGAEPLGLSPVTEERSRPPHIERRSEEDARKLLKRWSHRWATSELDLDRVPRSAIRVPFSHGSIVVAHRYIDAFSQRDVNLVTAFAEAMSLGFSRFSDFRRLEQQNRALDIERAVANVQSAVQGMAGSADIVRVITLLSNELDTLGIDFCFVRHQLGRHSARRDDILCDASPQTSVQVRYEIRRCGLRFRKCRKAR